GSRGVERRPALPPGGRPSRRRPRELRDAVRRRPLVPARLRRAIRGAQRPRAEHARARAHRADRRRARRGARAARARVRARRPGALQRNAPAPLGASTRATGLRYARWSGYVRAELRGRAGPAVLVPAMLRCAGRDGAARRAAEAARRAGFAPAVGWPGYEDRL